MRAVRIGLLVLGALLIGVAGCAWVGDRAVAVEIARVRAQCAPGNLLEVYDPNLFAKRSRQTRRGQKGDRVNDAGWSLKGEAASVVATVPFMSKTLVHRLLLMHGSTRVAALKFTGVYTNTPLVQSGIAHNLILFDCESTAHDFYVDKFEHEFAGAS
jgi:hypothetical protein